MIRVKISLGSFFLVYKSCIDCALKGVFLYPELIEEEELQSNKAHTSQPGDSFIIPVFHLRFVILCIYFHNTQLHVIFLLRNGKKYLYKFLVIVKTLVIENMITSRIMILPTLVTRSNRITK